MRFSKYTLALALALAVSLVGCKSKKKVAEVAQEPKVEIPAPPAWHTCLISSARATVNKDGSSFTSPVTMQVVRDSMLVISVTPMFGIEAFRLEATPFEIIGFDKLHGQFAKATYAEINHKLTPTLNWDVLQQLCSAELPTGSERARLYYTFGDDAIELVINYNTPRQIDVPVRVNNLRTDRYTQVDINKWL